MSIRPGPHRAHVGAIEKGTQGPYAVTNVNGIRGSVTFTLTVWKGETSPKVGDIVSLDGVHETEKGKLRARGATLIQRVNCI